MRIVLGVAVLGVFEVEVGCERSGCGGDLGRWRGEVLTGGGEWWIRSIVRTGGRRVESVEWEVAGRG